MSRLTCVPRAKNWARAMSWKEACGRREQSCASRCSSSTRVSGAHLWAETYERTFSPEAVFELQDDLVPRIVSTVADMHGVLPRSMSEAVRSKRSRAVEPIRGGAAQLRLLRTLHARRTCRSRTCLERAVRAGPWLMPSCWAMLSLMYCRRVRALGQCRGRIRSTGHCEPRGPRSKAAPLHSLPYYALAQALFFQARNSGFPSCGGTGRFAQPDGWSHGRVHGYAHCLRRRLGAGCALSEKVAN